MLSAQEQACERNTMVSTRSVIALGVVLVVDLVLAGFVGAEEATSFTGGSPGVRPVVIVGLCWQLVLITACAVVVGSWLRTRRDLFGRKQVLSAMAQSSVGWLWESDAEARFTYCSAGVHRLLGYHPADLLGRSAATLVEPFDEKLADKLATLTAADGWEDMDVCWRHADGSTVVLRGNAAAITDHHGRVVGFRGSRRPLTDAELAERDLGPARHRVSSMLTDRAMRVALQPIVDLNSGRLAGVEALARFDDGRSPELWFGEAAGTGQSLELDSLAFQAALSTFDRVPAGCYLSVNATPELILSGRVEQWLGDVPLGRLVIEVTEHARVRSYSQLQDALRRLHARGVRLAVDDTGAGYASLSHVLQLRPSIIKIDRSLITDIRTDPARRSLVTALVLLGLDLGATVTGEGIETPDERETLADLGVGFGQGYLLARPSTALADWRSWAHRSWLDAVGQAPPAPPQRLAASRASRAAHAQHLLSTHVDPRHEPRRR
ncbi:MAG: hypothetical protein JWP11_1624 [Frankiales bacterium]|nr:hypothetical protein [Frankiales bacterium]